MREQLAKATAQAIKEISLKDIYDAIGQGKQRQEEDFRYLNQRIDSLSQKIDTQIGQVNQRMDTLNQKIDTEVGQIRQEIGQLNQKIDSQGSQLNQRMDTVIQMLMELSKQIVELSKQK